MMVPQMSTLIKPIPESKMKISKKQKTPKSSKPYNIPPHNLLGSQQYEDFNRGVIGSGSVNFWACNVTPNPVSSGWSIIHRTPTESIKRPIPVRRFRTVGDFKSVGLGYHILKKKEEKNHIIELVQKSAQTPSTTKENFTNRDKPIAKTKNKGKQ